MIVDVKSVTGWGARLPVDEARGTLLATGVAGADLPAANAAPCLWPLRTAAASTGSSG